MTWLQGATTWGSLTAKLVQLMCGEVADDLAVTCASGDRWVRDISTSFDLIRTPSSSDVNTGTVHNRAGYFNLYSYGYATPAPGAVTWHKGVCQQTSLWSGVPTGVTNNRWHMMVSVETANTVSGNYSTALIRWAVQDGDTLTGLANSTVTPNAAGSCTITVGTRTVTFNVSDPSGFLLLGTVWYRGFTSVYLGGIDWFGPMWWRRSGNATFTVNPPGTAGTDYDANVDIGTPYAAGANWAVAHGGATMPVSTPVGGIFGGVGYKTAVGLTGAQYACSWNMALMKMRPVNSATAGQIDLEWGGTGINDAGTYRRVGGIRNSAWLTPFQTAGSVTGSSAVQYWMSVKPTKVVIILNGDPGSTGALTHGGVFTFTPFDFYGGGYDKFPIVVTRRSNDTASSSFTNYWWHQYSYQQLVWKQDGSESRDWQDKWMRTDFGVSTNDIAVGSNATDQWGVKWSAIGSAPTVVNGYSATVNGAIQGVSPSMPQMSTGTLGAISAPVANDKPNPITNKWRLYGFSIGDRVYGSGNPGTPYTSNVSGSGNQDDLPRGYVAASVNSPYLLLPGGQWATGDELTDTISGKKFFLVRCDAASGTQAGLFGVSAGTTFNGVTAYPGAAVLEE